MAGGRSIVYSSSNPFILPHHVTLLPQTPSSIQPYDAPTREPIQTDAPSTRAPKQWPPFIFPPATSESRRQGDKPEVSAWSEIVGCRVCAVSRRVVVGLVVVVAGGGGGGGELSQKKSPRADETTHAEIIMSLT